jgi:sec-independent protein translocase protein TatA
MMQTLLLLISGFSMPGGFEWIVILVAILLVFGGKKIPELMKGLGKGVKGFKDGLKGLEDEINDADSNTKK